MVRMSRRRFAMVEVLQTKRDAISAACARHGVARLEAFGSALRTDFRPGESDLDLLVDFRPMDSYARVEAYFGLLEELRALLEGDVDLVMVGAVKNPYIARSIQRTKQLLYAT
jgi:predicted nucleotidyltransferase